MQLINFVELWGKLVGERMKIHNHSSAFGKIAEDIKLLDQT